MKPIPKSIHALHVPRWSSFDEGKFELQKLLPVAALQLHAVAKQRCIVCHIKHPCPAIAVQGKIDSIRCDVARQLVAVHHLKRHAEVIQNLIGVQRRDSKNRMDCQSVALDIQHRSGAFGGPSVVQIRPRHIVSDHFPLGHRHRGLGHRLCKHRVGECAARLGAPHQHQGGTSVDRRRIQEGLARFKGAPSRIAVQPTFERSLVGGFAVGTSHVQHPHEMVEFRVIEKSFQGSHVIPGPNDFA